VTNASARDRRPKVLVAVDHSDSATRIAEFVHGFFGSLDVEIVAICVASAPSQVVPMDVGWGAVYPWGATPAPLGADVTKQQAAVALADAERSIHDCGLPEEDEIVEIGDPAEAIVRAADERHVDLIVVGACNRGLFQKLLSPSVSAHVTRRAHVPVLLVP
jgi:nucleotide-binding universal stress UspA family protein